MAPAPYDAAAVWWPPLDRLHATLAAAASACDAAPPPPALADVLAQHHAYLVRGLTLFKPPADDAAAALGVGGGRLSLTDGRSMEVDARLVPAALDVAAVAVSGVFVCGG